jgi:hypothetical protein
MYRQPFCGNARVCTDACAGFGTLNRKASHDVLVGYNDFAIYGRLVKAHKSLILNGALTALGSQQPRQPASDLQSPES